MRPRSFLARSNVWDLSIWNHSSCCTITFDLLAMKFYILPKAFNVGWNFGMRKVTVLYFSWIFLQVTRPFTPYLRLDHATTCNCFFFHSNFSLIYFKKKSWPLLCTQKKEWDVSCIACIPWVNIFDIIPYFRPSHWPWLKLSFLNLSDYNCVQCINRSEKCLVVFRKH